MRRTKDDKYQALVLQNRIFVHATTINNYTNPPAHILRVHLGQERRDGDPGSDKGKRKTGVHRHVEQNIPGGFKTFLYHMFSFLVLTLNRLCLAGRFFRWIATPGLRALTQNIDKDTTDGFNKINNSKNYATSSSVNSFTSQNRSTHFIQRSQ